MSAVSLISSCLKLQNKFDSSLLQATGHVIGDDGSKVDYQSKLKKVIQLSGFSDPVYVEAYVHINQYDIVLDVLVVNQTGDTLQGLSLELATLGDCCNVCAYKSTHEHSNTHTHTHTHDHTHTYTCTPTRIIC